MKTRSHPSVERVLPPFTVALCAAVCSLSLARAQTVITLPQLLAQGLTNSPLPYSLRVTGIKGLGLIGARLDDIYLDVSGTVRAHSGLLSLYYLNYDITVASVSTNGGGQMLLSGGMTLPKFLQNRLNKLHVTLPQAQPVLVVDSSGNIGFEGGTFTLPTPPYTFPFGPLTIENVTLTIDPALQTFGGGANVGIGGGPTVAFCAPQGSKRIHGDFLLVNDNLDRLSLGATNLKQPLGTSATFLDSVTATVGNLDSNGGANWFVQGTASVIGLGCPAPPNSENWPWRMNAQLTVNSAGYLDVQGSAFVYGIPTGQAYFRYNPPYTVSLGGSANFVTNTALQGIFIAQFGVQCTAGPQVAGFARGKLTVPRSVPVAGGWVFASAEASFNNSGFRGSVTVNLSPEIPSHCTPSYCLPGGCIKWWSPSWSHPGRTCKKCWNGPCFSSVCTPRIPAVSATVGFRYEGGNFTFASAAGSDPLVEPWEKSFQETLVEPQTGNSIRFMDNWSRLDKYSTGSHGRPIAPDGGPSPTPAPPPPPPPPLCFTVPDGEQSVMFRLTWENPSNALVYMTIAYSDYPRLVVADDGFSTNTHTLQAVDFWQNAYVIKDGSRREAIVGMANPLGGTYCVQIDNTQNMGNYAVELLSQNVAPVVHVNSVTSTTNSGAYQVNYTSTFRFGGTPTNPPTRIFLSQAARDGNPSFGITHLAKAGGTYLVDTITSTNGTNVYLLDTSSLPVPDGDYNVVVNIDDPYSLEVEDFSAQKITVHNVTAPAPVPSFATRGDNNGFTVSWQPSPSSNVVSYVVAYTASSAPNEFEFHQAVDGDVFTVAISGVTNGRPYLVTVFAMGTNSLQSRPAEIQRVIPTAGYGLNAPRIVSKPLVGVTAGRAYVYFPEVFDADDVIQPSVPLQDGEDVGTNSVPQDGQGRQWTLVNGPTGMTIDPVGLIRWTPDDSQVGDHQVTVRVTDLSSLPPLQDAGLLVSPRSDEQTYTLTVVSTNDPPALERNHFRFLTAAPATAYAGQAYRYVPVVLIPTNSFTLTVDDGPPGLSVVQEGTAPDITNVVVWNVPSDALGHRVVLRAVPNLGPATTADDTVLQEFYLNVSAPSKQLPQPTVINRAVSTPEGFGLSWVGSPGTELEFAL